MARWFLRIIFFFILFPLSSRAFSVSPLSHKVSIDPGNESKVWVDIVNDEDSTQIFKIGVIGASQNYLGQPVFKNNTDVAEGWVVAEHGEIEVKKGEKERVVFNIQVPKNAPPGNHYLGLFVEPKVQTANISVKGRLLALLTLQVSGIANEKISIRNWGGQKNVLFSDDLQFDLAILNYGNVSVPLNIASVLIDNKNGTIERKTITAGADLMAGQERILVVDFSNHDLKSGRYRVEVLIDYGITKQIIKKTKIFWFLAESAKYYLLAIIGVFITFIGLLYFMKKKTYAENK